MLIEKFWEDETDGYCRFSQVARRIFGQENGLRDSQCV